MRNIKSFLIGAITILLAITLVPIFIVIISPFILFFLVSALGDLIIGNCNGAKS